MMQSHRRSMMVLLPPRPVSLPPALYRARGQETRAARRLTGLEHLPSAGRGVRHALEDTKRLWGSGRLMSSSPLVCQVVGEFIGGITF